MYLIISSKPHTRSLIIFIIPGNKAKSTKLMPWNELLVSIIKWIIKEGEKTRYGIAPW